MSIEPAGDRETAIVEFTDAVVQVQRFYAAERADKLARSRSLGRDIHRRVWAERLGNVRRSWPRWFVDRAAMRRVPLR